MFMVGLIDSFVNHIDTLSSLWFRRTVHSPNSILEWNYTGLFHAVLLSEEFHNMQQWPAGTLNLQETQAGGQLN